MKEMLLDVKVTEKENWRREIEITVPAEKVAPKLDAAYKQYRQKAKLQGFRKGMVPKDLIKKMYGKEIETAVFDEVISDTYPDIIRTHNLKPIGQAQLDELSYDADGGLKAKILVDVEPEFEVHTYKGLKLEREIYEVTDAQVEETLEHLRQEQAMISSVDGEAEPGNIIVADFQKLDVTGIPILGEKYTDRRIELVEKADAPDEQKIIQQLIGIKAGEQRKLRIQVEIPPAKPNDSPRKSEEIYEVTVKEVQKKTIPEIDDEFAKDIGDFKTIKELKEALRTNLKLQNEMRSQNAFRQHVMDEVIKNNEIQVPQIMVDNYLQALIDTAHEQGNKKVDEAEVREKFRPDAIWRIKWSLIHDKIVAQEHLSVSDAELETRIEQLIEQDKNQGGNNAAYYQSEEGGRRIKSEMLEDKVIALITDTAKIKNRKLKHTSEKESNLIVTK